MATRDELTRAHEELHVHIAAAEDWQESYRKSPETFEALLLLEAALETAVAQYLLALSDRSLDYVDWTRLPATKLEADHGPVVNNDHPAWQNEEYYLSAAVIDIITDLIVTGALAGEDIYQIPAGFNTLDEAIMLAARTQVATMVSQVTDTTRKLIRESVATSIQLGEDATAAKARLLKVMNNPVRAELIAATESVNSYQTGLYNYAKSTGAVSKEWDGLAGACLRCAPLIGKTVPIDEPFTTTDGEKVMKPAIHPRDRCGIIYNYE